MAGLRATRGLQALFLALTLCLQTPAQGAEPPIRVTVDGDHGVFLINATVTTAAPLATVWEVMTDFEHMTSILSDVTSSTVLQRNGKVLIVHQAGITHYGLLSFAFESEREVHLEPTQRIFTRQISGTAKKLEGELRLESTPTGTVMYYQAEVHDDTFFARLFGAAFLRQEVTKQFRLMVAEMERRAKQ